jgi:hypothetical protein
MAADRKLPVQESPVQEGDTMKKVIVTLVLALFAFGAKNAFSQAIFTLRADVPFTFSIEGRDYAAGPYELRSINRSTVRLLNMETNDARFVMVVNSEQARTGWNRAAAPGLRFVLNGGTAYLVSLTEGNGNSWNVPMASKDLEALRVPHSKSVVVASK